MIRLHRSSIETRTRLRAYLSWWKIRLVKRFNLLREIMLQRKIFLAVKIAWPKLFRRPCSYWSILLVFLIWLEKLKSITHIRILLIEASRATCALAHIPLIRNGRVLLQIWLDGIRSIILVLKVVLIRLGTLIIVKSLSNFIWLNRSRLLIVCFRSVSKFVNATPINWRSLVYVTALIRISEAV